MPLDLGWVVKRALKKIRPSLFIIVEKEYWPNMIRLAESSGVPVLVCERYHLRTLIYRYNSLSFLFKDMLCQ